MPYSRLQFKPGVNTELSPLANRDGYSSSSLIRWRWGVPEVLRGWVKVFGTFALEGVCRAAHWWTDLTTQPHLAFGTNEKLYLSVGPATTPGTSILHDITPTAGFVPGSASSGAIPFSLLIWSLDNFGQDLVAVPSGQGVFIWVPPPSPFPSPSPATLIAQNAELTGGEVPNTTTPWTPITNGGFNISINGNVVALSGLDFSAVTDATDIAAVIQAGLAGIGYGSIVTVSGTSATDGNWQFTMETVAAGVGQSLSYATSPTASGSPTDISSLLMWTAATAQTLIEGTPAPAANQGAFVAMPEQIIVAYGSTPVPATPNAPAAAADPLLIRWCDQSNFYNWIASTTNQAGSFRLPRGSRIVGGLQGPSIALLFTDLDAWSMQYIGFPLVFGFFQIGSQCGLVAQKAVVAVGSGIFWMSDHGFFTLGAQGAQQLPCPIWDAVFLVADQMNWDKTVAGSDYLYGEVWWFFPSTLNGGEIDSYAKFNITEGEWDYGPATSDNPNLMARTAWTDLNKPGAPISVDLSSLVQQQDTGYLTSPATGQGVGIPGYIQSGYMDLTDGLDFQSVDQFIPDFLWEGASPSLLLTLYFRDYPGDTPTAMGPFTITPETEYVTLRTARKITMPDGTVFTAYPAVRAREVSVAIEGQSGWWRWGSPRIRRTQAGRL
jgi:hypothetical protein